MTRQIFRRPWPEDHFTLEGLRTRIPKAEHEQAQLRAANKIIRDPKLASDVKVARLVSECGIHPDDAPGVLQPDGTGHAGFRLLCSAASIRRMKRRLQALEQTAGESPTRILASFQPIQSRPNERPGSRIAP